MRRMWLTRGRPVVSGVTDQISAAATTRLLILANYRGWAWDHKAHNLKIELSKYGIHTDIYYMYDYVKDSRTGWHDIGYVPDQVIPYHDYDVVLVFSSILHYAFNDALDFSRTFMGVC